MAKQFKTYRLQLAALTRQVIAGLADWLKSTLPANPLPIGPAGYCVR
jgi:hypothetical protein